ASKRAPSANTLVQGKKKEVFPFLFLSDKGMKEQKVKFQTQKGLTPSSIIIPNPATSKPFTRQPKESATKPKPTVVS
ncbi:hypothetical protein EG871_14735, partial [Enterococcus faecium]